MDIYIGNLPFETTEADLQRTFDAHGWVRSVKLIQDKFSGNPLGFAFVDMPDEDEARAAVGALHKSRIGDRLVIVAHAPRRAERRDTAEVDAEAIS